LVLSRKIEPTDLLNPDGDTVKLKVNTFTRYFEFLTKGGQGKVEQQRNTFFFILF